MRGRLRPRIGADLVTAAVGLAETKPSTRPENTDLVDLDAANQIAGRLARITNAGRMASRARTQAGEIAAWNTVLELPEGFDDARDELEHYANHWAADLTSSRAEIQPVVEQLNGPQRSSTSWAFPVPDDAARGVWAGREHWLALAEDACDAARVRDENRLQAGPHTTRALLRARADFFDAHGRGCTAAAATIVERARTDHGLDVQDSTGLTRLRAINRVLVDAGLLIIHVTGRHLRSIERMAARDHHGGVQKAAGSVVDATVPPTLLPDTPTPPDGPAYAEGLDERLAARDTAERQAPSGMTIEQFIRSRVAARQETGVTSDDDTSSTYSCGYGRHSPSGNNWVAHKRAQARRANTETTPQGEKTPTRQTTGPTGHRDGRDNKVSGGYRQAISLRSWRIADDLTRHDPDNTLASGPYAHLTGSQGQSGATMTLSSLARLIERLTPDWAGTRDVLAGLTHAATSVSTGYVALGLHTRPANPIAWMTTVLTSIAWSDPEAFPAWSAVKETYGFHWCGSRREWENVS